MEARTTPRHPIAVVAERTGLSQDLLRIWERRYRAVHPGRGHAGRRLYSDADVERLSLLSEATRAGRSVGQIADLSTEALAELVREDAGAREERTRDPRGDAALREHVDLALEQVRALDAAGLEVAIRRTATELGMPRFLEQVATPLLHRIGDEWHAGRLTPAQEHLASAALYDFVTETMRSVAPRSGAPRLVVSTLAGDRHVIGAAIAGVAAAIEGWQILFLGADLPSSEIANVARVSNARLVAISVMLTQDRERVINELRSLRAQLPDDVVLLVGGGGAAAFAAELSAIDVRVETDLAGLLAALRRDPRAR